jgi:hypothetical protein
MGLHLEKHNLAGSIVSYAELYNQASLEFAQRDQELTVLLQVPVDLTKLQENDGQHFFCWPRDSLIRTVEAYLAAQALRDKRKVELESVAQQSVIMASGVREKPVRELPPAGKARRGHQKFTDEQIMRKMMIDARVLATKGKPLTTRIIARFCQPSSRRRRLTKRLVQEGKLTYKPFKFHVGSRGALAARPCLTLGSKGSK